MKNGNTKTYAVITVTQCNIKGLLHGYEWKVRFGALELRFG